MPLFLSALCAELTAMATEFAFEVIIVDDGSRDNTEQVARTHAQADPRIRYLKLVRNFGHQAALTAGLEAARGDCIICLDIDLQHPPGLIPKMLEHWKSGFDVVDTRRLSTAGGGPLKEPISRVFYQVLNRLTGLALHPGSADFRLLDRQVAEVIIRLPERRRFYRGLIPWMGFRRTTIDYEAATRIAGISKFSLVKMINLAADGIFSFTNLPLRAALIAGLFAIAAGAIYGIYAIYETFIAHRTVPGWTSLLLTLIFFSGINLFVLGILGEYLARLYDQAKGRPIYILDRRRSIRAEPADATVI